MAKPKYPAVVVNGVEYPAAVLLVVGRDEHGRPRECRFVHHDESITLHGGEEFLTVFAHGPSLAPKD